MRKNALLIALGASAALVLAACGGSSDSGTTTTDAPTTAAPTDSETPIGGGRAEAAAIVAEFSSSPTSINIDTPLTATPEPGALVVGLSNGSPANQTLNFYLETGAEALGWTFDEIVGAVDPETQQRAFQQALDMNPDYIHISGIPTATLAEGLQKAEAQGVVVICTACTDAPVDGLKDTSIAATADLQQWGTMIAAYVLVNTPEDTSPNVEMVTNQLYPILYEYDKAFISSLSGWDANAVINEADFAGFPDWGTKVPGAVVSALQRNPAAQWVSFDLGDASTGVQAALSAAGLTDQVGIVGLTASAPNIQALKDGTDRAWTAYSLPIVGWRAIDAMARAAVGDPFVQAPLPTQILTQENANSLVLDENGDYVGVADFEAQFKALWGVS
jgi:ribose transport system substrate-binding protein